MSYIKQVLMTTAMLMPDIQGLYNPVKTTEAERTVNAFPVQILILEYNNIQEKKCGLSRSIREVIKYKVQYLAKKGKIAIDEKGIASLEIKLLTNTPMESESKQTAELVQIKDVAISFFYWWWNNKGSNTERGFYEWAKRDESKKLIEDLERPLKEAKEMAEFKHNQAAEHKAILDGLYDQVFDLERQLQEKEEQWISVKDRLPELAVDVLVCTHKCNTRYPNVYVGYINDETRKWDLYTSDGLIADYNTNADYYSVTHWQPLPKPPKS